MFRDFYKTDDELFTKITVAENRTGQVQHELRRRFTEKGMEGEMSMPEYRALENATQGD